jgi:hypothetical protein
LVSSDAAYSCEAAGYGKKTGIGLEPKGFVAAPSQLRTIDAPALPRSNLIEATLFD